MDSFCIVSIILKNPVVDIFEMYEVPSHKYTQKIYKCLYSLWQGLFKLDNNFHPGFFLQN